MSVLLIKANRISQYMEAHEHDCIQLVFTSTIHAPVMNNGISGTVTTRPGELGVVVRCKV